MLIDIINSKSREIISAPVSSTMRTIVDTMSSKNVGGLALTEPNGKIVGLITERVVVVGCAKHGHAFLDQPARAHMTAPLPTCSLSDSVSSTMRRMTRERTRHLFVLDGDKVAGFISIGDVVKARMRDADLESLVLRDIAQSKLLASN